MVLLATIVTTQNEDKLVTNREKSDDLQRECKEEFLRKPEYEQRANREKSLFEAQEKHTKSAALNCRCAVENLPP